MSAQEQVTKLEALLARVTTRRAAPRPEAASGPAPEHVHAAPPVTAAALTAPPVVAAPVEARAQTPAPATVEPRSMEAPIAIATPREPIVPAAATPAAARDVHATEPPGADVDVVIEEGTAEVDLEGIEEEEEAAAAALSDSVADLDAVAGPHDDLPASSRRPIQMQPPLEELAFGDAPEAKQAHPAPPESRRQVATPEFDNDLLKSGVRPLPSAEAAPRGETPTTPPGSVAATPELAADVTRPAVAAASPAVFRGAAPTAKPATFGDLLDDSLGL